MHSIQDFHQQKQKLKLSGRTQSLAFSTTCEQMTCNLSFYETGPRTMNDQCIKSRSHIVGPGEVLLRYSLFDNCSNNDLFYSSLQYLPCLPDNIFLGPEQ
uniref:Uncharacterized protein n=1 Tax=Lygus hesperus TaxID=30085 RepID=A0A0A9WEX3_LYGHE